MSSTVMDPETERVVEAAHRASPEVAARPYAERAGWLESLAEALTAHRDELVDIADRETHLGAQRLAGEVVRTTGQLRMFADAVREGAFLEAIIDHRRDDATPPAPDLRRMLVPLGPVAVFAASNFPFAFSVLGGDTASALAGGNPVVVKAHEGHPVLSRRVLELAQEAVQDAPAGLIGMIEGQAQGVALVQDSRIRAVGFTGSQRGGRYLFDLAMARPDPIPFHGELGSLNPVVVTEAAAEARAEEIAAGLAASFTLGAGQFCTKPGLVLTPAGSGLADRVAAHAGPVPHPLLNERIAAGFRDGLAQMLTTDGVERVSDHSDTAPAVLRTSTDRVREAPEVLLEEVFGPTTLIVEYRDEADLNDVLTLLPASLTASVHTAEGEDVGAAMAALTERAGRVVFGGWPTGVAVTAAQHHGGPYPASTSVHTSVGTTAVRRFLRPLCYQDVPEACLPLALRDGNPLGIPRQVDGATVG
ncbi:aldehyde dehydrogenase (NADP(+)) [Ruania alba]|uniref:NADP-dependent aldehyde dehydrogenase n=1 Tax=Ruania alba TaxID=648782 RepID=A0A1H5MEX1_9MICO|nr:aldehyde dehydrogenase (NADP(+)) [Ruania alba]SEE87630.1 NADP-dependent aldehyde dehydrogenase [Ruania alba]